MVHSSAWKASDFASKADITMSLEPDDLRALDRALEGVKDREPETVEVGDFDLGSMTERVESLRCTRAPNLKTLMNPTNGVTC